MRSNVIMCIRVLTLSSFIFLWMGCNKDSLVFCDDRDGESYSIIVMGNQRWMGENLRYNMPNSIISSDSTITDKGRLYDWNSAQTACPSGWHLPSDEEWSELEVTLGMDPDDALEPGDRGAHGHAMKSISGWSSNGNGDNSSGFNALPTKSYLYGIRGLFGTLAHYWTSSETTSATAWQRYLIYNRSSVSRSDNGKQNLFSCRCVED